jgi:cell division transport system permease protein
MKYSLKIAIKSLWHERWINLLSILSIAVGLFILGFVIFVLYNVEILTRGAPEKFTVTLFLKKDVTDTQVKGLLRKIKKNEIVKSVRYISKDEAFRELKHSLKDAAYILEGIDENPLFPSVEIKLKERSFDKDAIEKFIGSLRKDRRVDEVIYGQQLLGTIQEIYSSVKILSVIVGLLFCVAIAFVSYSTVKVLFYRRKEEIEVYKLLGATKGFIRSPFIFEGLLLGLLGGGLASLGNLTLFSILKGMSNPAVPVLKGVVLPEEILFSLPLAGLLLGLVGSAIALGKIKY